MIRVWLHGGFTLAALMVLAVGAICAQPGDAAAMRAFFSAPEGCIAPCFLGIRPSLTSQDEVIALLNRNPWVIDIKVTEDSIWWMWNGKQPTFIASLEGYYAGRIDTREGVVTQVNLLTTTQLGDFLAVFGAPDRIVSEMRYSPSASFIEQSAVYRAQGFEVSTSARCPIQAPRDLWYSMVFVIWRSDANYNPIRDVPSC